MLLSWVPEVCKSNGEMTNLTPQATVIIACADNRATNHGSAGVASLPAGLLRRHRAAQHMPSAGRAVSAPPGPRVNRPARSNHLPCRAIRSNHLPRRAMVQDPRCGAVLSITTTAQRT